MIGAQTLHATGYAMGVQRDGAVGTGDPDRDAAVIAHFGDGASSQGDVNEAFIFAASYNAPVVFFCQNNQWAISEPIERQSRIPLYQRALGFGFPGVRVDGNDVLATYAVTQAALQRAREGSGPTLVEAYTYRMGAHTTTDDPTRYRLSDDVEHWKLKDPIARLEVYLRRNGLVEDGFVETVAEEAKELGHHLREGCKALADPEADGHVRPRLRGADRRAAPAARGLRGVPRDVRGDERMSNATQRITLAKALNMGLRKAMEDDPKVLIMGEDVGKLGGVFRITDGLQKDFGEDRVIDSPLAESGIVGTAVGLALRGYRPVVEIQFDGFVYPAYDQIVTPGRQDELPLQGPLADADGHPDPVRRWHRCRRAPLREPGGAVRAHARAQGGRLLQPGRRLLDDPAGDRLRRPGDLPGAQAAVPRRQGRPRRLGDARPAVLEQGRPPRHRRDRARLRADGEDRDGRPPRPRPPKGARSR